MVRQTEVKPCPIDSSDLIFKEISEHSLISTFSAFNKLTERFIFIDFLDETERHALIVLWDGDEELGTFPVFKKNIKDDTLENIAASIWNNFFYAESAVPLLSRKIIGQLARYSSPLNMIAEIAASVGAKRAARIYAARKRQEGAEATQFDELDNTYFFPQELQLVYTKLRLNILNWFATNPQEAEKAHRDYWRATTAAALHDLDSQGVKVAELSRKQLKKQLNNCVFNNEDFDGREVAIQHCGKALAVKILSINDFLNLPTRSMEQFLAIEKASVEKKPKPPLLTFEIEAILPFGEVEEAIKMNWQCPGESDLEIIHNGGIDSSLPLSYQEVIEGVGEALKWWRSKENELREVRQRITDDPKEGFSYMRRVLLERRHSRRYMRSRYGLDMGRRRILRKLRRPLTIEDTARRAFYYGNAMALEMAADASMFTLDWLKDQVNEAGKDLNDEDIAKFVGHRAANAAIGVMEALPLFHCAIMEKTSNPTIREVELYVLSGFAGAHISLLRFPRLRNAITRKELMEQLPEAVSRAVAERRLGEPLIRGRNSIRNRVSRFLEAQNKLSKEQTDFLELIEEDVMESVTMEASPPDKEIFELSEEAKAQFAEKVAQTDLSPRERSVLELKMEGYSQKEIAAKLNITTGTVKRLRARAYSKLRA